MYPEKWFYEDWNLDEEMIFGLSDSGYSNEKFGFAWLSYFEYHSRPENPDQWYILLIHGYTSHKIMEFAEFTEQYNILLYCLFSYIIHLLQLLDIRIF